MTVTETARRAIEYIMREEGEKICIKLRSHEYERMLCDKHCKGLDQFCVKRLLKYNENEDQI